MQTMRYNRVLRNIAKLTGGTIISQALLILALPVVTRLYSPTDFKLLASYAAVVAILVVIASLRWNVAVPLPKSDLIAAALLVLAATGVAGTVLILSIIVLTFPNSVLALLKQPDLAPYLWLVPVGVGLAGIYDLLQMWMTRRRDFTVVAATRIGQAFASTVSQIGLGLLGFKPLGLLFGAATAQGVGVLPFLHRVWSQDRALFMSLGRTKLARTAYAWRRYPQYSIFEALFDTGAVQLPLIIIAATAVTPEAGFLLLAMRVMALPVRLVGSSVAQVFISEAPERLQNGELGHFTRKIVLNLTRTGAPAFIGLGISAPFLFPLVFGEEWARAGVILAWLTPGALLQFIISPITVIPHLYKRVRLAMGLQAFGFVLRIGPLFWLASIGAEHLLVPVLAVTNVVYSLGCATVLYWVMWLPSEKSMS